MQNLPSPDTYQKEFTYMPWGILIKEVQDLIVKSTPRNGKILDLLCGTGYLIGELQKKRPDCSFTGVDLEPQYIAYARNMYPRGEFVIADAATWVSPIQFDAVLCTGGLHHLAYEKQESFIQKLSTLVTDGGLVIVADPYIDDFDSEEERRNAVTLLGNEYVTATRDNGAPPDVIQAAEQLIANDVEGLEFKSSIKKIEPLFRTNFSRVEMHKTWPSHESEYGDYYFVLRK